MRLQVPVKHRDYTCTFHRYKPKGAASSAARKAETRSFDDDRFSAGEHEKRTPHNDEIRLSALREMVGPRVYDKIVASHAQQQPGQHALDKPELRRTVERVVRANAMKSATTHAEKVAIKAQLQSAEAQAKTDPPSFDLVCVSGSILVLIGRVCSALGVWLSFLGT